MNIHATRVLWNNSGPWFRQAAARFNFGEALGGGNDYDVHCQTKPNGQFLAVKIPDVHLSGPRFRQAVEYLKHEAEAHAFISEPAHPNLAGYRDHGEIECEVDDQGRTQTMTLFYLAMEYVEGVDMNTMIRLAKGYDPDKKTAFDLSSALFYTLSAAQGLKQIHDKGWAYGDLKPDNMQRSRDGKRLVLLDFTSSRPAGKYILTEGPNSRGGFTPDYASEARQAGRPPVPADDVFALGVSFYEMLTGDLPFFNKPMRFFDYAGLGVYIAALSKINVSQPAIELLHKLTGTSERPALTQAGEVVEYILHTPQLNGLLRL